MFSVFFKASLYLYINNLEKVSIYTIKRILFLVFDQYRYKAVTLLLLQEVELSKPKFLLTIFCNSFTNKLSRSFSVLIDIVAEPFIRHIHLSQSCQYLFSAGIILLGNVILELLY